MKCISIKTITDETESTDRHIRKAFSLIGLLRFELQGAASARVANLLDRLEARLCDIRANNNSITINLTEEED